MNYLKTKWIQRLIENDFVEVKPTKTWKPKYRIFINSYLAGHAVVVEPEHPYFNSWKDIQKHIKGQIK